VSPMPHGTQRTQRRGNGPALAMIEVGDLPRGLVALDALAKEAPVTVIAAGSIQNGNWLIAFEGGVEPVEMSFERATRAASGVLVDTVLLPNAEPRILPALLDGTAAVPAAGDTLGVLQTATSPTLLRAIDAALKGADVELVELRVAEGLAGRGLATVWGALTDVQAAIELATEAFGRGCAAGCSTAVIPNADDEVRRALGASTRLFKEWRG
jgi:microcompartment protein CcmL/EutN